MFHGFLSRFAILCTLVYRLFHWQRIYGGKKVLTWTSVWCSGSLRAKQKIKDHEFAHDRGQRARSLFPAPSLFLSLCIFFGRYSLVGRARERSRENMGRGWKEARDAVLWWLFLSREFHPMECGVPFRLESSQSPGRSLGFSSFTNTPSYICMDLNGYILYHIRGSSLNPMTAIM